MTTQNRHPTGPLSRQPFGHIAMPLHTTRAVWKCACMQAMRATGVAYRLTVATFATAGRGFIPVAAQRPLNWVGLAGFAAAALICDHDRQVRTRHCLCGNRCHHRLDPLMELTNAYSRARHAVATKSVNNGPRRLVDREKPMPIPMCATDSDQSHKPAI